MQKTINILKHYRCYLIAVLLSFIICTQSAVAEWWQSSVIDGLPIKYGWHTVVLLVLFCSWCVYKFIRLWRRLVFDERIVAGLLAYVLLYIYYRFIDSDNIFSFELLWGDFAYVDVLAFISIAFIFEGFYNRTIIKGEEKPNGSCALALDMPINNREEDKLEYYDSAWKLADYISGLPFDSSHSIAVLSPWGNGKTSYMNLIKYAVTHGVKDGKPIMDCIVVEFNPRRSKTVQNIQEDFFTVFSETLSKYDSNISSSISRYLATLGLSINNPVLTFFLKAMSHDESKSQERINQYLLNLPQRIIVFIDDFDRLTADEMIEVLKLIDRNASFKKVTFVTAFDREYVDSVLSKHFGDGKKTFADKFFTLEYQLPIRPYTRLIGLLYEMLQPQTTSTKSESDELRNFMFSQRALFQIAIKNVRDVKRFYNQFIIDYVEIKGQVKLDEYIVVELMKFRFRNEFEALKNKEYINASGLFGTSGVYTLKQDCKPDGRVKSYPLLRYLFTDSIDGLDSPLNYLSIKRVLKFDTYFYNKLYGQIPEKDFNKLYSMTSDEILSQYDTWISMNLKANIIDHIIYTDWQNIKDAVGNPDWSKFSKFVEMTMLLAFETHGDDFNLRVLISRLLYKPNLEECGYYGKTVDEYMNFMVSSLYGDFTRVPIEVIADISSQMARKPQNNEEQQHIDRQVIDLATYHEKNVEYLRWYIEQHESFDLDVLRIYRLCIKEVSRNDKIIMQEEANEAIREYIEGDDNCTYLRNFIRYVFQDNIKFVPIQCDVFCRQIFSITETGDMFEAYVKNASIDDELRSDILTYWSKYKTLWQKNEWPLYEYKGGSPTLTEIVNAL